MFFFFFILRLHLSGAALVSSESHVTVVVLVVFLYFGAFHLFAVNFAACYQLGVLYNTRYFLYNFLKKRKCCNREELAYILVRRIIA